VPTAPAHASSSQWRPEFITFMTFMEVMQNKVWIV